ncbi:hypothetical protein SAMN04490179_3470 [Pseudomonas antarctica]|uniref:Uncharacterized protein n=1 Tax=Pseudomonas antarctica TaxID=219572 RepID=A0A1H0A433_9PSED|nr:hypothetical protein [Pseudomonas antarctica]KAF2407094.1 hypothetical protein PSAN_40220 [Pseudomonas antarctica]SDN28187.1 hypothetical protein SAMN04490179_3470 [Pseudomonas antarctica]
MDRTNRDIIDSFIPKVPADYQVMRLSAGSFDGQVPGFPGLLTRAAAKSQFLTYRVPLWDFPSTDPLAPNVVTIQIRPYAAVPVFPAGHALAGMPNANAEDLYFVSPPGYSVEVSNPSDPFVMNIPEEYLQNGAWLIRYTVYDPDTDTRNSSVAQLLIVDETAPYDVTGDRPPEPTLPSGLSGPLNLALFQSLGEVNFPFVYLLEQGKSPGDTVSVYYGSSDRPIQFASGTRIPIDPAQPTVCTVPYSAVMAEKRGIHEVSYIVYDAAGNPSQQSYKLTLEDMAGDPAPSGFAPLVILLAETDSLINSADVSANNGAIARVPPFMNPVRPSDSITCVLTSVNGSITLTKPVGASGFPDFQFTPDNMATLYGTGPGFVAVTATYTVSRGTNTYPTPPLSTRFDLNLEPVGPTLVTDLLPVVVEAVRPNNVFGPPNHLELADVNRDARFRIPLWTTNRTPETILPFTVSVVYGGRVYSTDVTSINVDREVIIPLPFSEIIALGGPTQPVFYSITRPGNPNVGTTSQHDVIVDSAVRRLGTPTVQNTAGINKSAGCNSLSPVNTGTLRVFIPGSDLLSTSEPVVVTYVGFQNDTATGPGLTPVVKSFNLPNDAARRVGFTVDLGTAQELYDPIHNNRANAISGSAIVTISTQYMGQTVSSLPETIRVRGRIAGPAGTSYYCSGAVIPA